MEGTAGPRLDELYGDAPCGLLVAAAKGPIVRVNRTLCRWLGYEPEDLVDKLRFQDLLTMGGKIFHQTHLAPLLRMQGSVAELKLEFRTRTGAILPMLLNLSERAAHDGLYMHVAAVIVADRHKYEQELLRQRRRAEELAELHARDQRELALARAQAEDRALFAEQMMGIVSHDLRNPLSVIAMSNVLLERGGLDDRQRVIVARMGRSVSRAQRLIADLLDFTQARLGRGLSVNPSRIDLHEVVAESVGELSTAYPDRAIRHQRHGPGACLADADRVVQAVGNLVSNAVAYGSPDRPITVATSGYAQHLELSVHNEGTAIPRELLATVFEPMIRGDNATSRGVGLGLYIVRGIAQAHGGAIRVESAPESGTTFVMSLACAAPA